MKPKPKNPAAVAMGQIRSRKKTLAARANGAKGGFWATRKGIARRKAEDIQNYKAAREYEARWDLGMRSGTED